MVACRSAPVTATRASLFDPQLGSRQRHFERCRVAGVADEQIRRSVGDDIERTTDRDTAHLMSPPAEVLYRREESQVARRSR